MKKILCGLLCVFSCVLNAADNHNHAAMQQSTSVQDSVKYDIPVMIHAGTEDRVVSAGFERLEWQKSPESTAMLAWDFFAYTGNDHYRWWLKSEGEAAEKNTEEAYIQAIYSQPVSPFWDVQVGLHGNVEPDQKNYLLAGMFGLAPGFIDINSYLLLGSDGDVIWHFEAGYDFKLTRYWVLLADIEFTANAQNNINNLSGSGLSESLFGVRIAYERVRKLVPYAGIEWQRHYGKTRDYRQNSGEPVAEWQAVAGINVWY